jgi:hypothetical protein
MTTIAAIIALVSANPRAVERAMLALVGNTALTTYDAKGVKYYADWIKSGHALDGKHLARATTIARQYAPILAALAAAKGNITAIAPIAPKCQALTLHRQGKFTLDTVPGTDHCGTMSRLTVAYETRIVCAPRLDSRGFLVDQVNVDRFFQRQGKTSLSCERLAMDLAAKLHASLVKENPAVTIRTMDLTLSPEPFAARMTVTL